MKTASILAAMTVALQSLHAGIEWEKKELEFFPASTDTEAKATFRFINKGPRAVTIARLEPACGCTTAALAKRTYQPGEAGQIDMVFTFGQRTGTQSKALTVTIEGEKDPTLLAMITHLPEQLKIAPQFVFWQAGEAAGKKVIELNVLRDAPIRIIRVTSSHPEIVAALETIEEGKSYRVNVTPRDLTKPVAAGLTIEAEVAPKILQYYTVHAHIKQSKKGAIWVYDGSQGTPTRAK